jgi:5-methylcytosine-specific restriction endonuclease McrA
MPKREHGKDGKFLKKNRKISTCPTCGKVFETFPCNLGKDIQAHHIIHMSNDISKALEVDNGVTLCLKCHQKEHPNIKLFGVM